MMRLKAALDPDEVLSRGRLLPSRARAWRIWVMLKLGKVRHGPHPPTGPGVDIRRQPQCGARGGE
jgi:hypothetical protein